MAPGQGPTSRWNRMGTPSSVEDGEQWLKRARRRRWARFAVMTLLASIALFLLGLEVWELWVLVGVSVYLRWAMRGR